MVGPAGRFCQSAPPLTQDEIDAGSLTNTATATGTPPAGGDISDDDSATANITQSPAVDIVKTPDIGDAGQPLNKAVGDTVTFTYAVTTGTGNVSLENVVVTDNLEATVTFVTGDDDSDGELDVGETWTYTADHTVTQAELDAGVIGTAVDGDSGTATLLFQILCLGDLRGGYDPVEGDLRSGLFSIW